MAKLDRNSVVDAQIVFEKLIIDNTTRQIVVDFYKSAIEYANSLNSEKWNLNLDINGGFIRFNVGHEYCIELTQNRILILCNRLTLNPKELQILYRGHKNHKRIESFKIDEVPDCLAKTKNSIGCVIKISDINNNLKYLQKSNFDFIDLAIKTYLYPHMKRAHSIGAVEYIMNNGVAKNYEIKKQLPSLKQFIDKEEKEIKKAVNLNRERRLELLQQSNPKATKTEVNHTVFNRNQYVIAEVLFRANGICEKCKKPAPFLTDKNQKPFLEVHHIIPLAEGGDDTIENAIGLCPNCHRHAHYGKETY